MHFDDTNGKVQGFYEPGPYCSVCDFVIESEEY